MAFYGIPTPGLALTASTAGDTIQLFNNSTAVVSANTIIGLNGNDIINLGAEGYTATSVSRSEMTVAVSGVNGSGSLVVSGALYGADEVYQSSFATTQSAISGGGLFSATVTVSGVITSENAVRRIGGSQIFGNQDNDSIALGNQLTNLSASTIGGGAGNDLIGTYTYVNQQWTGSRISTGSTFVSSLIEGGGGNDIINIHTTGSVQTTTIQGGAGEDVMTLSGVGNFDSIQLLGGGDADAVNARADIISGSTIAGGGSNDTLIVSGSGASKTLFAGDVFNVSDSVYDGADVMQIGFVSASAISVQGGGGNDSILFSALGAKNYIAGNLGNDTIWMQTAVSASTVYGGAGNDSILLSGGLLGNTYIFGGGDKDTINFAGEVGSGDLYASTTVYGGLGADKFVASAVKPNTTIGVTFGYSAYADSTISAMDSIAFGSTGDSAAYVLDFAPAGLALGSFSGSQAAIATGTNGIVTFTSTFDSDVTARYNVINTDMTTAGATVIFKDGAGVNYLFIQGGTSDDLISQVGLTASGVAAISIIGQRQITIDTV